MHVAQRLATAAAVLLAATAPAAAESRVVVSSTTARPGQPILVTVRGATAAPAGDVVAARTTSLEFFKVRDGYQALFAVPHDAEPGAYAIRVGGAAEARITVVPHQFPATALTVEDELANPPPAERPRVDADNAAIVEASREAKGPAKFTGAFKKPAGAKTSPFGTWRTFNDGHRSQHLGLDVSAKSGSKVLAVNAGTVTLVRDCFLAGNVVVIAHGAGIASSYYHLEKALVADGDEVKAGTPIGLAGDTGRATGPHLHLGIWVAGGYVDPEVFFKLGVGPVVAATK